MQANLFSDTRFTILDGALGTMLQNAGVRAGERPEAFMLREPAAVTAIHRAYIEAGADIIYANTFGSNAKKLEGSGISVGEAVRVAVACAKDAAAGTGAKVALDVGPLGEMLAPGGVLGFEQAVALFAEAMAAGEAAGADLIAIETMADLYEVKASVLAARENTGLPFIVSMSFEENGRTFAGVPVEALAVAIGGLGAAALGINCSLGPAAIMPLAKRLCEATDLPVFIKPNAGLPNPATGEYALSAQAFVQEMEPCFDMGVAAVGGCCGTDPGFIRALAGAFQGKTPATRAFTLQSRVCSGTRVVVVDGVCPVGERINPTGKIQLQQALAAGDLSALQTLAVQQAAAGAMLLDVNVGAPGVNEVEMLPRAVQAVQAVCDLPLQIDSANPAALAAALRVYNGKPALNSTSGEAAKMDRILPLAKQYAAAVVGLTLDEEGIPKTAKKRLSIAKTILGRALAAGIAKEDVWVDCLTLTASAEPKAPGETLAALAQVHDELGLKTVLGVSNVSFGLPGRPLLNRTFLAMALAAGLDLPILNPCDAEMMDVAAAFSLLCGRDTDAREYLARFAGEGGQAPAAPAGPKQEMSLEEAVVNGLSRAAGDATSQLIGEGAAMMEIVDGHLAPALDKVGAEFNSGRVYLPQLLASAAAAQYAFEVLQAKFALGGNKGPVVVLATVQGDVHDIGKNIVKVLLQNYDYQVVDLGRDVSPGRVVEAVKASGAGLVGLSALMTTTLPAMEATIAALREAGLDCSVMVGGAVLTEEYAKTIGANHYAKDALSGVDIARKVFPR